MERLFELEPAPACSDHASPALLAGWLELVAEVGYCDVCGDVVWIRLGRFDETPSSDGETSSAGDLG
jgi:hypothetical protein